MVLDNCLERISKDSGENTPVDQHQVISGFVLFVDCDDLILNVSGVSGKSQPGFMVEHLSRYGG